MNFGYTIIYVRDVEKALAFYEKAFGQKRKFVAPESLYGELKSKGCTLAFAKAGFIAPQVGGKVTLSDPKKPPSAFEIAFTTKDVKKAFATAVKAGAKKVAAPVKKPWGQTVAYVRDPEGILVELCTPI